MGRTKSKSTILKKMGNNLLQCRTNE